MFWRLTWLSVVPAHRIEVALGADDAHVAAAGLHGRYLQPGAGGGVEGAARVEVADAVEAADRVDQSVERGQAVVGPRTRSVAHTGADPAVRAAVVALHEVRGRSTRPSSHGYSVTLKTRFLFRTDRNKSQCEPLEVNDRTLPLFYRWNLKNGSILNQKKSAAIFKPSKMKKMKQMTKWKNEKKK